MVGVGLSRLWGTHPRLAFVLHLLVMLMMGGFALSFVLSGGGWAIILITGIGFLWVLFAVASLLGWVLLSVGSGFGVALVVLSLPLAVVAMRVGK